MPYDIDMANSTKKYYTTAAGVMNWAASELEHVGRIASVKDTDIQYSYALSTVNSMLHLRDALVELLNDPYYVSYKEDLTRTHDQVVQVIKKLIKDYSVNIETIRAFNTRRVLGNLTNFAPAAAPAPAASLAPATAASLAPALNLRPVGVNNRRVGMNSTPLNVKPLNVKPANAKPANAKPANTKPLTANTAPKPWYWPF